MSIVVDKTEVMVLTYDGKQPEEKVEVKYGDGGAHLKITNKKKILGITVDDKMSFKEHIEERTSAGFSALRSIDSFIQEQNDCSQSVYMKLYKTLVLPVMEYGSPAIVSALTECCKGFGKVHRSAMMKASGCLNNTSTDALEILTNTLLGLTD